MKRLEELGLVIKLPPPIGGYGGGSGEAVYMPAGSKSRGMNIHQLEVAELFVRLNEIAATGVFELLAFDPEPWCHVTVGHTELKPDFYLKVKTTAGMYMYYGEVDLGTEYRPQLSQKMRRYCSAYDNWNEPTFPQVVWIVRDADRKRFVETVTRRQPYPTLHKVVLFEDFVSWALRAL